MSRHARSSWLDTPKGSVHLRKDGTTFPVEVSSRSFEVHGERLLHSIIRDLTESRRNEQRIREGEARLGRVLDGSMEGFFDLDLATGASTLSDRVARMLGLEPRDLPPSLDGWFSVVHPEDLPGFKEEVGAVLAGERRAFDHDIRAQAKDGSWRWLRVRARVTGGASGEGLHYSGTLTDVSDQRRAQEQLWEAFRDNEALVQQVQEALDNVKTLSGLLPICVHCHKVRNDQGYWDRIEQYITERTDAAFSHGLCPDCFQKHYPPGE
jgi:PAS domain S-box-containing protein